jgi:Tfp pilus assembly protein FimV
MLRFASVLLMCATCSAKAADMSVDQAVSRLLKDIETEVEVLKVPVPAKAQSGKRAQVDESGTTTVLTNGTHRVRRGETLDMVIRKVAPNSTIQPRVLRQAFVRANPHAFRRGNPNWLYAGAVLQVPDIEHLRQVIFKSSLNRLKKNISDEKAGWVRFP